MVSYRLQLVMVVVLVALAPGLMGCSDSKKKPTEPEPEPEVPRVVQTFRGQLDQGERDCNNFSMGNAGTIVLEIVELRPLQTITMGMSLGQQDSTNPSGCSSFADDDSVRVFQSFASSGLAAGAYCACVFDVGNIFPDETVDYTLEVTHPE